MTHIAMFIFANRATSDKNFTVTVTKLEIM